MTSSIDETHHVLSIQASIEYFAIRWPPTSMSSRVWIMSNVVGVLRLRMIGWSHEVTTLEIVATGASIVARRAAPSG